MHTECTRLVCNAQISKERVLCHVYLALTITICKFRFLEGMCTVIGMSGEGVMLSLGPVVRTMSIALATQQALL